VGKLDAVFGSASGPKSAENGGERYQDVTAQLALTAVILGLIELVCPRAFNWQKNAGRKN